MTKRYVFGKILLVCALMFSLSSCGVNGVLLDFVTTETDVVLVVQWEESIEESGVCFVIRDNRIFALSCDISKYQPYENSLFDLSIHKYMGSHKMTREEQEKVHMYLEQIKNIKEDEFLVARNGIEKGGPFLVLRYNDRIILSCVQAELFFPEERPNKLQYEEGYYVLNEFAQYVCTLMPKVFDNFL